MAFAWRRQSVARHLNLSLQVPAVPVHHRRTFFSAYSSTFAVVLCADRGLNPIERKSLMSLYFLLAFGSERFLKHFLIVLFPPGRNHLWWYTLELGLNQNVRSDTCDPCEVHFEITSGACEDYKQKLIPSGAREIRNDHRYLLTGCTACKLKRRLKLFRSARLLFLNCV